MRKALSEPTPHKRKPRKKAAEGEGEQVQQSGTVWIKVEELP